MVAAKPIAFLANRNRRGWDIGGRHAALLHSIQRQAFCPSLYANLRVDLNYLQFHYLQNGGHSFFEFGAAKVKEGLIGTTLIYCTSQKGYQNWWQGFFLI